MYRRAHDGGGGDRELRVGEYATDDFTVGECVFHLSCGATGGVLDVFAWKTKLKKRNGFLLLYW